MVDAALAQLIRVQVGRTRANTDSGEALARFEALRDYYGEWSVEHPERVYPAAGSPRFEERRAPRVRADVPAYDWSWRSDIEPLHAPTRDRFLSRRANGTAWARTHWRGEGRPVLVALHGYLGGYFAIEERKFQVEAWLQRGFNVCMPVLPFHGLRREGLLREAPPFPSHDLFFSAEGFRQVIFDLRTLYAELRRRGATSIVALGTSLGGYTQALLATLDHDLEHVGLFTPAASLADVALAQGQLGNDAQTPVLLAAMQRALRVVSPLARPAKVPGERVMVVAAGADRITPGSHAALLAEHFGAESHSIEGGHIVQFGRARSHALLYERLRLQGIAPTAA